MSKKIEIIIIVVLAVILCAMVYVAVGLKSSSSIIHAEPQIPSQENSENKPGENPSTSDASSIETIGATTITENKTVNGEEYTSSNADENALLVTDGAVVDAVDIEVNKTGDTSNTENSEFYGVNAGVLAKTNADLTINHSTITTNSKGSNAVFATGENAKIYIGDTHIETSSDSSRGLDATYGGYIEADNVTISTKGGSCATLATDRGEGTVIARNSTLSTAGKGSPIIYSTGNITLEDSKGTATGSQMVVIEGKNSATVQNSTLVASGKGNRNDVDNCGIMIYQSMSGDAGEGTGTLTAKNSSLSIDSDSSYYKTAPFFFVTNTNAVINLEKSELDFGSGVLLSAKGTSEWGKSGSNGGIVKFNAVKQELVGNIELDELSELELNLTSNSSYEGAINSDNTAKSVVLTLDSSSKITLTGNTYVTEFKDEDTSYSNIDFNGYSLYVNGKAIN